MRGKKKPQTAGGRRNAAEKERKQGDSRIAAESGGKTDDIGTQDHGPQDSGRKAAGHRRTQNQKKAGQKQIWHWNGYRKRLGNTERKRRKCRR